MKAGQRIEPEPISKQHARVGFHRFGLHVGQGQIGPGEVYDILAVAKAGDGVVAIAEIETDPVRAGAECEIVVAGAEHDEIVTVSGKDIVAPSLAPQHVIADPALDIVMAIAGIDNIVASVAEQAVIAVAAGKRIVTVFAEQGIVSFRSVEEVVARVRRHYILSSPSPPKMLFAEDDPIRMSLKLSPIHFRR